MSGRVKMTKIVQLNRESVKRRCWSISEWLLPRTVQIHLAKGDDDLRESLP